MGVPSERTCEAWVCVTFVISSNLEGHNRRYLTLLQSTGVDIISAAGQPLDLELRNSCEDFQAYLWT